MAQKGRVLVNLSCSECKRKNYQTTKNKSRGTGRIELKKFCRACRTHTVHKESK